MNFATQKFLISVMLNSSLKDIFLGGAGRGWLMPIILATQVAEIRRIEIQSQLRQIVP
jgi:hypothetical protein